LMIEIEERKRILEQLHKSEETYRLLFEFNLAGVFRVAVDPATLRGTRIDCNDAYAQMLGCSSRKELIDADVMDVFPSENAWKEYVSRIMEKGKLINYENRLVRKDGRSLWVVLNVSMRKMDDDSRWLIEGTAVDVTARKQAEEQMRSAHRKLRAMASEMVRTEERERQQIATILHDTVAQTLAAAKINFENVQDHIVSADGLKLMAETRELLTQSIKQARSIMAELSPPVLNEIGFIPALEWLTERVSDQNGISIQFDSTDDFHPLPHDIEVLLYQATRELLANIVKHAKAKSASVTVSRKNGGVQIEVSDDGVGLDKAKIGYHGDLSGGFGLFSIQERMKHFGGEFSIRSRKGEGTRITMLVTHGRPGKLS
jgi:PAS domain S-box-containing protein